MPGLFVVGAFSFFPPPPSKSLRRTDTVRYRKGKRMPGFCLLPSAFGSSTKARFFFGSWQLPKVTGHGGPLPRGASDLHAVPDAAAAARAAARPELWELWGLGPAASKWGCVNLEREKNGWVVRLASFCINQPAR